MGPDGPSPSPKSPAAASVPPPSRRSRHTGCSRGVREDGHSLRQRGPTRGLRRPGPGNSARRHTGCRRGGTGGRPRRGRGPPHRRRGRRRYGRPAVAPGGTCAVTSASVTGMPPAASRSTMRWSRVWRGAAGVLGLGEQPRVGGVEVVGEQVQRTPSRAVEISTPGTTRTPTRSPVASASDQPAVESWSVIATTSSPARAAATTKPRRASRCRRWRSSGCGGRCAAPPP